MGARILAVGTSTEPSTRGAIAHAVIAARDCLAQAALAGDTDGASVDLLLWAGVYRDDNIVEPAIAALVQRELGLCLDYTKDRRAVFSFDLMNGACGLLNALQVATAYIDSGSARRVLVVASDAHPSGADDAAGFPYVACGGAFLLGVDDEDANGGPAFLSGRLCVRDDDDDHRPGVEGFLSFETAGVAGRRHITVVRDDDVDRRALTLLASCARACLHDEGLQSDDITVVASLPSSASSSLVAQALGAPAERVVVASEVMPGAHTAGLAVAWRSAVGRARTNAVLLASVGAGLTAGCLVVRRGAR